MKCQLHSGSVSPKQIKYAGFMQVMLASPHMEYIYLLDCAACIA